MGCPYNENVKTAAKINSHSSHANFALSLISLQTNLIYLDFYLATPVLNLASYKWENLKLFFN